MTAIADTELVERLQGFYRNYYHEEILELVGKYPSEQTHLTIDWGDIFQFDQYIAEDFIKSPDRIRNNLITALQQYDLPVPINLDGVGVWVVGLDDDSIYTPLELTREGPKGYVGIAGELSKVSTPVDILNNAAFECRLCGTITRVPQGGDGLIEPTECQGCERNGPYMVNSEQSEFESYCKVRVETPPDETGDLQSEYVDGYVQGALVWHGSDVGLVGRNGEPVRIYGRVEHRQKTGRGVNDRLFETHFDVEALEFDTEKDDLDIPKYKPKFEELAQRDDVIELWKDSLVPELYATDEWDTALELLVTYLFAAPRISIPEGPTFRGDIHVLIISDYGMGKSMVNNAVAFFSPQCIKESVTGLSSDVGLLAAAVEDDFSDSQWTLQPGILVRGNGGHVILDEIDKTDADLERMNDALEGEQVIDINKAGQSATYKSRIGLLATGNPKHARFNRYDPISEQLDLDQSLLSRFDAIVTMADTADETQDANVAATAGESYVEAFEYEYGDRDELDSLERVITPDIGRNWVAYARANVHPMPKREHIERIKEWYATDVRRLNEDFEGDEGVDMPVPVNARIIKATIRRAVAFARIKLQEEVTSDDVERAIKLSKELVGQNFDGEKFVPEENKAGDKGERKKRHDMIVAYLEGNTMPVSQIAQDLKLDREQVEHDLKRLVEKGRVDKLANNRYSA